jgi:hypothetical protein
MKGLQKNIAHDKAIIAFLEYLEKELDYEDRERCAKLIHDEWHEGHAKGWSDAVSCYPSYLNRAIEAWLSFDTFSAVKYRKILKAVFGEHGYINDYREFVKQALAK